MAIQGTYRGAVVSFKNDEGGVILPYRIVSLKAQGTVEYPSATGKDFIGASLLNLLYDDGSSADQKAISVQIDGIVDLDCYGVVSVGDYVKVYGAAGQVESAGVANSLSGAGTGALIALVGQAIEAGNNSRIAVLLRPQVI